MGEKVRIYFTFHYVSINTDIPGLDFLKNRTLHSTMFLLIPVLIKGVSKQKVFTFHYVSINTCIAGWILSREVIFTFHYFSINTGIVLRDFTGRFLSLHSTMFLLIHKRYAGGKPGDQNFTFHYVSINTCLSVLLSQGRSNFTFHYVSINTQSGSW